MKNRRIAERRQESILSKRITELSGYEDMRWHDRRSYNFELPDGIFNKIASALKCHRLRPIKIRLGA